MPVIPHVAPREHRPIVVGAGPANVASLLPDEVARMLRELNSI